MLGRAGRAYYSGMPTPNTTNALTALRHLTIEEVEQRLTEIDGERASLALLRRSLAARERAKQRTAQRFPSKAEGRDV
ncbi:hypothetical protein LCGC14_1298350 [marine sediment metagenome]|uniref:Uncharacterized protein n=1 Tax=marine sediment metagenome TaxID=412755 RepID=A0A0F9LAY7_9ZZZZ